MNKILKSTNTIVKENDEMWIIATTKDVDRMGDIVEPKGWLNKDAFMKTNPVMLFGHDSSSFPIGKYIDAIQTDNDVRLKAVFADTEDGRTAKYLFDNGFMNTFSIGFIPKKYEPIKNGDGRKFLEWELLEVSAVPIPANPNAIVMRSIENENARKFFDIAQSEIVDKPKAKYKLYQHNKECKNMDKIAILKELISKETDEAKIKQFQDEIEKEIAEISKAKAEAEYKAKLEERELEIAKLKSDFGIPGKISAVGVGDRYKGFQVKKEIEGFKNIPKNFRIYAPNLTEDAAKAMKDSLSDEGKAETMVKFWIDKLEQAHSNPMSQLKAMNEGTTTAGGFLTPDILRPELASYIREQSLAMRYARMIPMTSDVNYINRENAKVTVALTSEATDATEATPSFTQATLTAKKIAAYTEVSTELLQDSITPIAAMLLSQFVEAVGLYCDSTVFLGPGNPMSGVMKSAGYSQVFGTGSSNFSELLESDLRAIIAKVAVTEVTDACKWFCSHAVKWNFLYGLKDSQNRPLFIDSPSAGGNGRLHGFETLTGSQMPSTSAASTGFIYFGDLAGVVIGERLTNIELIANPYAKMIAGITQYVLFTRWAFVNLLPNKGGRIVTAA
jgi:HK97 family phage major capsid protein/HK97 family phage prohead protease